MNTDIDCWPHKVVMPVEPPPVKAVPDNVKGIIFAKDAAEGCRYLTRKGHPLEIVRRIGLGRVLVHLLATDSQTTIPELDLLAPWDRSRINHEALSCARWYGTREFRREAVEDAVAGRGGPSRPVSKRPAGKPQCAGFSLSGFIDGLLEEGGKTVLQIAKDIEDMATESGLILADKYTPRYVHSRISFMRKRGREVVKDSRGAVSVKAVKAGNNLKGVR